MCLSGEELKSSIDKARAEITKKITKSDCDNIIISGEAISTLKKSELEKFKLYLENIKFEYEIICSIRSPYSFMCSDHQEVIKVNSALMEDIFVRDKFSHVVNLDAVFKNRVRYYSFHEACKWKTGITNHFLAYIGCKELPETCKEIRSNNGLNNLSTRMYSFLNKKHPNIVSGKLNPLGRGFDTVDLDSQKFLLTKEELTPLKSEIEEQNKLFFDRFGSKFCDKKNRNHR